MYVVYYKLPNGKNDDFITDSKQEYLQTKRKLEEQGAEIVHVDIQRVY